MNIRRFRLINRDGAGYNLTTRDHFLHTPSGLGFQKETEYQRLGNQYIILNDAFAQAQIMGEVFFPNPGAYTKYYEFIRFCQNAPLYLLYKPASREFYRSVRLSNVEKTELEFGGLNVTVTFDALTLFYEEVSAFNDKAVATSGKTYNYRYNYVYSGGALNTVTIESDSYAQSPCTVYIYGACIDPIWYHYVNGVLKSTGSLTGEIPDGQKLAIDTTEIPYSIKRVDMANRFVADVYGFADFSTERFIMLEHGENTISIQHSGADALTIAIEAQILYASV